jgi:hypothetical protein
MTMRPWEPLDPLQKNQHIEAVLTFQNRLNRLSNRLNRHECSIEAVFKPPLKISKVPL